MIARIITGIAWCLATQFVAAPEVAAGCTSCHRDIEPIAVGKMAVRIKEMGEHYTDAEGCTVCHGGNPSANDADQAHQGAPLPLARAGGAESFYRDPGNIWVATRTCGKCHEEHVENFRKSVMSTGAGFIERNLCLPGWQKRRGRADAPQAFGRYAISDDDGPEPAKGSPAYKRYIGSLRAQRPEFFADRLSELPSVVLQGDDKKESRCRSCHENGDRSKHGMSCSACHMRYQTGEHAASMVDTGHSGTLFAHRIQGAGNTQVTRHDGTTTSWPGIPMENCFACHYDPRVAGVNPIGDASVHYGGLHGGRGRGLFCQDCHTSIEMHGDGNLATANEAQTEVRCEDCHGTIAGFPWELPLGYGGTEDSAIGSEGPRGTAEVSTAQQGRYPAKDGNVLTSRGNPFGNVVRQGDRVLLHSVSGEVYEVTLLKERASRGTWRSELGRQVKSTPDMHSGMACLDCHADWLPACLGCHNANALTASQ